MSYGFLDIATTPGVRAAQHANGSDDYWESFKGDRRFDRFTENERHFIVTRDSFYLATVSSTGWPYIQHRGGPPGFLCVFDDRTFGFADYRGNRQYISTGNLATDDRVALILVDYPRRARLKIYAHATVQSLGADLALTENLLVPGYKAKAERLILLKLDAFDWNCPQHITPRFTESEIAQAVKPLRDRLAALEAENAKLRERLDRADATARTDD